MVCSLSSPAADARLSFQWLARGEASPDLIAMRCAIYGGELAWVGRGDATFAWDAYDRVSTALLVRDAAARLVASGRLTVEQEGPLEVSDLVDWKSALPPELREAPAAEWSRVMIDRPWRGGGLFRRMYQEAREAAKRRGARLFAGASVGELRPHYEGLGFTYLDLPFRSCFFDASPVYFPAYQVIA
jgi:GNAT superfamily N-acetyltransferase